MLANLRTIYMLPDRGTLHKLCVSEYHGHRRGCPNYGKKEGCPPRQAWLHDVFLLSEPCYFVINVFRFGEHVKRMRDRHPDWSDKQLRNCLYWQGGARKELRRRTDKALRRLPNGYASNMCPEAMGIDVTRTCAELGMHLEWPPMQFACQVAFVGMPLERRD